MLDINYDSKVTRNAPEADIPIYNIVDTQYILGGAGNVANNLKSLDANVELVGLVGNDTTGNIIKSKLEYTQIEHKLFMDNRNTTQKYRIFLNNEINVRFDIEDTCDISDVIENDIIYYITHKQKTDAIIISDYDKGFITQRLCQTIIKYANENNIPTFVDPKIKNYLKYKNCFLFKPNIIESENLTNQREIELIINSIKTNINCKNLLITRGKDGMILNHSKNIIEHDSEINVVDVTGAGDVCLSVLVYCFLKYGNILESCKISNYVSGKSVGVIGNYNVNNNDINEYINKRGINISTNKIIYDYEIEKIEKISSLENVVFTNGCFDILHSGHIKLLQFAKNNGNILVVGLNSDESVKRLKGKERPINDINERSSILELFDFIDYIIIYSEDTPLQVIKYLKPNVLIKGSDYKREDIVGCEFVKNIILFDYIDNKSTTRLVKIIKNFI